MSYAPLVYTCLGVKFAEQATRLMHLDPPKREEDLADHIEIWQNLKPMH